MSCLFSAYIPGEDLSNKVHQLQEYFHKQLEMFNIVCIDLLSNPFIQMFFKNSMTS